MLNCAFYSRILTALQLSQAAVFSFPMFPDVSRGHPPVWSHQHVRAIYLSAPQIHSTSSPSLPTTLNTNLLQPPTHPPTQPTNQPTNHPIQTNRPTPRPLRWST